MTSYWGAEKNTLEDTQTRTSTRGRDQDRTCVLKTNYRPPGLLHLGFTWQQVIAEFGTC